jgi:hypothetical protein
VLNATDTTTGTGARWGTDEYTAVPDPIEADTDYSFDTSAAAAEHGTPWAVLENPDAYTNGPVTPGHYITAGHHPEAAYYLASREPLLPWQLSDDRIAGMVEAATLILGPTEDKLRTAVQAVTEAVSEAAARAVAQAHPDAAVEVEHALWGTPALRYDGTDQEQAALYERGIPSDHLLEGALASTPGALIAAASIRAQRTAAAQNPEPTRLEEEKTSALPAPGAEPELTAVDIAQIRALQAASFPTSAGTHQPPARARAAAGTDPAATRTPTPAAGRGYGR